MTIQTKHFGNLSPEVRAKIALNKRKFAADQASFEGGEAVPIKPKKKRAHKEDDFQISLTEWLDYQANLYKFIWYTIPNGGRRDAKTGALLKRMGVKAGIPDLFISRACNGFHGCYVELKVGRGRLSYEQEVKIAVLRHANYQVLIVRTMDEAIAEISKYLNI